MTVGLVVGVGFGLVLAVAVVVGVYLVVIGCIGRGKWWWV